MGFAISLVIVAACCFTSSLVVAYVVTRLTTR